MIKMCATALLFSCLLFTACKSIEKATPVEEEVIHKLEKTTSKKSLYTRGLIIDKTGFDGCTFLIEVNDSTTFEPVNLDSAFKIDSLTVEFSYRLSRAASICMMGQTVSILEMKKK